MYASYRDGAPPEAPVLAHRQLPEQHDGYLLIPSREATNLKTRPSYTGITRASQAREAGSTPVGRSRFKSLKYKDLCFDRKNGEAPYLSKVTRIVTVRVVKEKRCILRIHFLQELLRKPARPVGMLDSGMKRLSDLFVPARFMFHLRGEETVGILQLRQPRLS